MPKLFAANVDYAEYIAASVYIHDYSKFFEKTDDKWLKLCLERDLVLQTNLEKTIHDALQATPKLINLGISMVWSELDADGPFLPIQHLGNRWFETRLRSSVTNSLIHYNIATGSLLVDSKPLSTLPEKYTQDALYKQVLGDKLLNVAASDDSKMEYMTMSKLDGHRLYFGFLGSPSVLQIHARRNDLHYVAILRSKFGDDLPERIVAKSSPWLCVNTSCIEFRNMGDPWCPAKSDWNISPIAITESLYRMESQKQILMDSHIGVGSTICCVEFTRNVEVHSHSLRQREEEADH